MTQELADAITPPNTLALKFMKDAKPPVIVTANGVVGSKELIEAIIRASGKNYPILPSDPKQVEQIQDLADPHVPEPPFLRPEGQKKLMRGPEKPSRSPDASKMDLAPGRVKLPRQFGGDQINETFKPNKSRQQGIRSELEYKLPKEDGFAPLGTSNPILTPHPMHTPYYLRKEEAQLILNTPTAPPTPTPMQTPPSPDTPRAHSPSYYLPRPYPRNQDSILPPPNHPPVQGYDPSIHHEYPQRQMQTQHLNNLMTEPQPQENPAGPKAHPLPGDESTLPYY